MNSFWEPLDFELPDLRDHQWHRWINTALEAPSDISEWKHAPVVRGKIYRLEPRSLVVLIARK